MKKSRISKKLGIIILCLTMILKAHSTSLWVGQSYVCDAASAVVGLTTNVSWSCTGGYINMTGTGFARTVTATQYWSGTAYVTCTWQYRLTANSTWKSQSKTWTFSCQENPIHIIPTEMTLSIGQTASVNYYHEYSNSYTSSANTYFSCSGNVVSVTRDGTVTALNPGTAYINVYSNISNAANAPYCTVTVRKPAPQSVSIDSPIEIDADVSKNLSVSVYPSNASISSAVWGIQEGSECISLTPSGYLTGIKPGTSKINCIVNNSIASNTATVIVHEPPFIQKNSVPSANAAGVSAFATPSVTFSSSLFEGDNYSSICLKNADTGENVCGTMAIDGSTLKFIPASPLGEQTNYMLTIPANSIRNKWGTHYNSDITIPFKTGEWEKLMLSMTPESGLVMSGVSAVLQSSVSSANIYYTTDTSIPTKQSLPYTSPITIKQDLTIKAIAIADGYHSSEIVEGAFQVTSLKPLTDGQETINKKDIPSIKFSTNIKKGEHFEDIQLLQGNASVVGEFLIVESTLYFVPQEELVQGNTYTLNIPEMAIISFQEGYNIPIQKTFKIRKDVSKPFIAAGSSCSFVIKDDGSLWAWGANSYGQLGDSTTNSRTLPVKVLDNVISIVTEGGSTFAIRGDGSLWAWGNNYDGQLGNGTTINQSIPVKVLDDVISVVASSSYTLALKSDNSLWAWGNNVKGQLGDGTTIQRTMPVKVLENVISICVGSNGNNPFSLAIKKDNSLWAWGENSFGKLGDGTTNSRTSPVKVLDDVISVVAGINHTLAVKKDKSLWAWGDNYYGQLGDYTTTGRKAPVKVLDNVISVAAGDDYSLAIKGDNSLWIWGDNSSGQIGNGTTTKVNHPIKVLDDVVMVSKGDDAIFAIVNDNSLWAWGKNYKGKLGDGTAKNQTNPIKILDEVAFVAVGSSHTLALKSDGCLWAWGGNYNGQLGDGTTSNQTSPMQLFEDYTFITIKGGHVLATKNDKSLWAWGSNYWGQLGDGTKTDRPNPINVLDNVKFAATGYAHSLTVKTDGTLWAWGENNYGQLGDGTKTNKTTPEKVFDDVISVSAGGNSTVSYSMAVKTDGSLWAWGYNSECQLGDGTTTTRTSPIKVLDDVLAVTTGYAHTLALKRDGSLWGWGYNCYGQLGDGSSTKCSLPEKILDDVAFVSAGESHSLAIKKDGSLWAWGYNIYGQIGDGTKTNRLTPTKVLDDVTFVAAGESHSLAIKKDGSLWAWGKNGSGQLGDGTGTERTSPVKVLNDVTCVAAGSSHTFAIKNDGSIWGWGLRSYQLGIDPYVKVQSQIDMFSELFVLNDILLKDNLQIVKGEKSLLIPQIIPITAKYESMLWKSSDESIVSVTPRGIITGVAIGEAILTVNVFSTKGIKFTGVCRVKVTESTTVNGDTNGDGNVDAQDALQILQYVTKKTGNVSNADVNGDGVVDAQDASLILQYVAKKITW